MTSIRRVGSYYTIEPGQGEPDFFEHTLAELGTAMGRARHLSHAGQAQQLSVTTDGKTKVIFEYQDGKETFRSCAGLIPAGGPAPVPPERPAAVTQLAGRTRKPRPRRRPAKATWPGVDLNAPPCTTGN